jgi:hypothetical protein
MHSGGSLKDAARRLTGPCEESPFRGPSRMWGDSGILWGEGANMQVKEKVELHYDI